MYGLWRAVLSGRNEYHGYDVAAVRCTTWFRNGMIWYITGNWEQAYNRLKKTNNFPEFTSRVCPALCEAACTCGLLWRSGICKGNEYGIIENAYEKGYADSQNRQECEPAKQVAVIGSGPAGLAVADQLNKRGHQCNRI